MLRRDQEALAGLFRINRDMGGVALRMLREIEEGELSARELRQVARFLSALADDVRQHADEIEPRTD